ncbi:putative bifunctional UDP-N-acetylglucosamine transferase and deubiquitinase ALG13 isoform X1 [Lepisosteus oculatus]|uniref:putative bifunctional UDP-N-acetylglucosamine transferase and deubiquitinase ALG13 isoform X1 n=1 Tax=Lepisosteus oculatus TaxID=7918 RepID=UPI00371CF3C2
MQKGLKKYFMNMDDYLASIGLYRKMVARDASCLFRAVSEQLYCSQNYHQDVRKACVDFMRANRCNFEPFVEGSFEKYLQRLEDPKETAGQVEIKALSLLFKRQFIIYKSPGKSPTEIAENECPEKILLCCSNNGHYDIVYPKHYPTDAALCQGIVYELLYSRVFSIEEVEIQGALEAFHSGGHRYHNSTSVGSEDASFDTPDDKTQRSSSENKEEWETSGQNRCEGKLGTDDSKMSDGLPKVSFPYKVLKALDSEIYRNVEFDVWHDSRKEFQKTDYMVFAGRQYFLGDKCQVRLEPGGKYYNAFIQEVGRNTNAVTVFIEELGEKHLVSLTNLRPVNLVPAWNITPNRKGGTYSRISDMYPPELDQEMRGRRRFYKKPRGKEMYLAMAYSRGQPGLPPRLQHGLPSGRSPAIHPAGNTGLAPYEQCRLHPSNQRPGRGYGPPRNSARFINRHQLAGPEIPYCSNPGKRCYQSFDSYSYRSRSCSRGRQQVHCVNKECQFNFVPENGEETQGMEGTVAFYEIEEGDEAAFPPLPGQAVAGPVVSASAAFWLQRGTSPVPSGKQAVTSSEEDVDERSNSGEYAEDYIYAAPEPGYQSPSVYAAAESTNNLDALNGERVLLQSLQEGGSHAGSPPEGVATYTYSPQVVVSSAVMSSPGVTPAPAVFTTNSTGSLQSTVSSAPSSQSVIQPMVVPQHSAGRPVVLSALSLPYPPSALVFVNEAGEPVSAPPPPPYSCDPNGNDLPRDYKVLQYYFNLGVQWYHQNCWNATVQMQQLYQQPVAEQYQSYSGSAPRAEQNLPHQPYGEGVQVADQRGDTTSGAILNVEPSLSAQGAVYYPIMPDQCSQQPLPMYDPYVPVLPAYRYVTPWPPLNQPRVLGPLYPNSTHQVGYMASSALPPHFVPQGM